MQFHNNMVDHFSPEELEPRFEMTPWVDVEPVPCCCEEQTEVSGDGA